MTHLPLYSDASLCFVGSKPLDQLATGAQKRLSATFHPKTIKCYHMLFRLLVAFYLLTKILLKSVTVMNVLSYLEYLTLDAVSPTMLSNYLSALKAKFTIYRLNYQVFSFFLYVFTNQ